MDFLVNLLGRLLQFIMQLTLIKMITMYLPKTEAAQYFVILLVAGGASIILISPIGQYFNRKIIEFERKEILSLQLTLFFSYTVFVSPIVMIISYLYFGLQDISSSVMVYIASSFYFIAITFNQVAVGGLNILGRSKLFVGYSLLTQFLIIVQLFILNSFELNHLTWVGSLVAGNIAVGILALRSLNDGSHKIIQTNLKLGLSKNRIYLQMQEVWKFSGKILVTLICIWIFQVGFRFELLPMIGVEAFALFTVGYSLAVLIFAGCEQVLNSYCLPIYYKKIDSDLASSSSAWNWLAAIAGPTYLVALFFTITFSNILAILILDSSYHSAAQYVKIGAILEFLRVIYSLLSLHAHGLNNTKLLVKPSLAGLLIFGLGHLILNFSLNYNSLLYLVIFSSSVAMYTLWHSYNKSDNPIKINSISMVKLLPLLSSLVLVYAYLPVDLSYSKMALVFCFSAIVCLLFWLAVFKATIVEIMLKFNKEHN